MDASDSSVLLESTAESVVDSDAPRPKVKRTYGRRKEVSCDDDEAGPAEDLSSSATYVGKGELGPKVSQGTEDYFGIKQSMARIDEDFDDLNFVIEKGKGRKTSAQRSLSSSPTRDPLQSAPSSPSPSRRTSAIPRRAIKKVVHYSDESDGEKPPIVPDTHSSPVSPQFTHPINSPKSRSSTPPTSEPEATQSSPTKLLGTNKPSLLTEGDRGSDNDEEKTSASAGNKKKGVGKKLARKTQTKSQLSEGQRRRQSEGLPLPVANFKKHTVADLLSKIAPSNSAESSQVADKNQSVSSDPIQPWSSPPQPLRLSRRSVSAATTERKVPEPLVKMDTEDLPDVSDILLRQQEAENKKKADAIKKRVLGKQPVARPVPDSDDDDLVIEDDAESILSRSLGPKPKAATKSSHLRPSAAHSRRKSTGGIPKLAKPARPGTSRAGLRSVTTGLFKKAGEEAQRIVAKKEAEWKEQGGVLKNRRSDAASTDYAAAMKKIAEDTLAREGQEVSTELKTEEDSESDEDWTPDINRGSASPVPTSKDEVDYSTLETVTEDMNFSESNLQDASSQDEQDTDEEPTRRLHSRPLAMPRRVEDSGSEDESNGHPRVLVPNTSMIIDTDQALAHRGSLSSLDATTPDDDDKENDQSRMYDNSEDKENQVVPRHGPGRLAFGNAMDELGDRTRNLSVSPTTSVSSDRARRRLREKPTLLGDPIDLSPSSSRAGAFGTLPRESMVGKQFGQPRSLPSSPGAGVLQPAFSPKSAASMRSYNNIGDAPQSSLGLRGNFMDLFDEGAQSQGPIEVAPANVGVLSQFFEPSAKPQSNFFKRPKDLDDISLTQDMKVQQIEDVSTQLRRKADDIMEKEDLFVLEEANHKKDTKPVLYVSENGLLTQTRPDVSTPVVYRAPTQKPVPLSAQSTLPMSTQRQPLQTLSFTSTDEMPTPSAAALTRLTRGRPQAASSPHLSHQENDHETPTEQKKMDAFSLLLQNAKKAEEREKETAGRSAFVQGEAEESDEDEMFGFSLKKKDDDEGEEEDEGAQIEGLLDDNAMDQDTLNVDKVLEKVKEQYEVDDANLQKYHEDAIQGKFRQKRRSGVNLDSDDEDEDDDEKAKRLRERNLRKKRRLAGADPLEKLGQEADTKPFYDGYQREINDNDADAMNFLVSDDVDGADEADDEEDDPETISPEELRREVQIFAKNKQTEDAPRFDPEDVSIAYNHDDDDAEDMEFDTFEIATKKPLAHPRQVRAAGDADPEHAARLRNAQVDHWNSTSLTEWAKQQSGRNVAGAAARGATAVTGHGQPKGGRATTPSASTAAVSEGSRKLSKGPSMLASVNDKQSRFDS